MNDRKTIEDYRKAIYELLDNFHRIYTYEMVMYDRDICIEAMGYLRACRLIARCEIDFVYIDVLYHIDVLYSALSIILVDHDRANL